MCSGGTTLTVIGDNLGNANPFKIEIVRSDESDTDVTESYLADSKQHVSCSIVLIIKLPPIYLKTIQCTLANVLNTHF